MCRQNRQIPDEDDQSLYSMHMHVSCGLSVYTMYIVRMYMYLSVKFAFNLLCGIHLFFAYFVSPLQGPTCEHIHSDRRLEHGWQHPTGPTGQDCQESWP